MTQYFGVDGLGSALQNGGTRYRPREKIPTTGHIKRLGHGKSLARGTYISRVQYFDVDGLGSALQNGEIRYRQREEIPTIRHIKRLGHGKA